MYCAALSYAGGFQIKQEPLSSWAESRMDLTDFDDLQMLSPANSDLEEEAAAPLTLQQTDASSEYLMQQFEALLASQAQQQSKQEQVLTPPSSPPQQIQEVVITCEVTPAQMLLKEEEVSTIDTAWLMSTDSSSCSDSVSSSEWEADSPQSRSPSTFSRQRAKPYARRVAPQDRRERKKEQNKNAATRYRMKKKAEVDVLLTEEQVLDNKNKNLQEKVDELNWELKYLKNLLRDMCHARKS